MYTGVRVELSNGLRLDIFRGMAAIDKMDHFVMGRIYQSKITPSA
jgi:hypothetical protein